MESTSSFSQEKSSSAEQTVANDSAMIRIPQYLLGLAGFRQIAYAADLWEGAGSQAQLQSRDVHAVHIGIPPALRNGGNLTIYPQDDRTCPANSTQFTGTVVVSPEKQLFFWFVESRKDPLNDPTILWLNGGPGASSMPGLFQEVGPCTLAENNTKAVFAPDSWTNFANLLFLDQPAGAGLSTVQGNATPTVLSDASIDFQSFLRNFTAEFPKYFTHGFYIAGESFGGRYAPRFVADIVFKQKCNASDAISTKVDGVVLVDALVDGAMNAMGQYDLFCTEDYQKILLFNGSTCYDMNQALPRLGQLVKTCQDTLIPKNCKNAQSFSEQAIEKYFDNLVTRANFSPYDLRLPCELPDRHCIPPSLFYTDTYLNDPGIQSLLGIDPARQYLSINFTLNALWSGDPSEEISLPTTQNVTWLIDEGHVRFLVFNGVYDATITTPGMFREFEALNWSKKLDFGNEPRSTWYWTDASGNNKEGGQTKYLAGLQIASVYGAGHTSPQDQRGATESLVKQWLGNMITQLP